MNEFNANKQINSYMFPSDYTELYLFLNSKNAKMLYLNRFGLAVNKTQLQQLRIENNKKNVDVLVQDQCNLARIVSMDFGESLISLTK